MGKFFLSLLVFMIGSQPIFGQAGLDTAKNYSFDLYLLIGQSNMAGRGEIEEQDQVPLDSVYFLNKQFIWMKAADPIHFDKPNAGVGLAKSFGEEMRKNYPNKVIGLIPCAVGGSSIQHWQPGVMHQQTISYPWDNMEERLSYALQFGELKGILWHQGEGDSNPENCLGYKAKLLSLIERVRAISEYGDVPFVAGELGKFFVKKNKGLYPEMKKCPASIVIKSTREAVRQVPNAGFVQSKGLESDGGKVHFNSEAYRELGIRYANMMIRVQNKY